ncbi:MAG: peptide deformylase [Candidatus Roizmanbacteria bacterium]
MISIMKILHTPNPVLQKRAKEVSAIDKTITELLKGMIEALVTHKDPEGVGLAAPQVGVSQRIFVMKPDKKSPITIYINPVILSVGKLRAPKEEERQPLEGCLSIPKIWGIVHRGESVELEWMDEKGKSHHETFTGFSATIIQHEIDHLDGVLFTKRVLEQKNPLYKEKNGELEEFEI